MGLDFRVRLLQPTSLVRRLRVPEIDVKAFDLFDQQEDGLSGRAKIVIAIGIKTRAPGAELLDLGLVQTIAQRSPLGSGAQSTTARVWGDVARLTVTSFDVEQAPSARGPFGFFLGDYECLTNIGTTFVPAFISVNNGSMPTAWTSWSGDPTARGRRWARFALEPGRLAFPKVEPASRDSGALPVDESTDVRPQFRPALCAGLIESHSLHGVR